jgi:hypothetical protein
MIEGTQFTSTCHVDDIKLSHMDKAVVTRVIKWLKSIYGDDTRALRGKVHDYLGMTLEFTKKGEVKVSMIGYPK